MEITKFKKKKMKLLTNEQQKSYGNAKICQICKEKIEHKYAKHRKIFQSAAHSICNYDYHFLL